MGDNPNQLLLFTKNNHKEAALSMLKFAKQDLQRWI